jgi:D-beta-D-heptose 7-phosphate kinase/D-beta-D-heptose 1-phosphate adenosyltransferase
MGTYILKKEDISSFEKEKRPTIVFTNGCFDVLHRGHFELLEKSKALGDKLIIGLNSDASVRRLKGDDRPFFSQENRKTALEAITYVDEVIIFDEDTPIELIKKIKPDIITKGGDYTVENVVGNDLARVVIIPSVEGQSTTKTLQKMKR